MQGNRYIAPEILEPLSLSQLAQIIHRRPRALLMGGGVHVRVNQDSELFSLPAEIVLLHKVAELTRLTRNDHFLEVGASVTLQHFLEQAGEYLPPILSQTIKEIATVALRNQMTIAGSIALPNYRSDLFVVLALLEAKVEIRDFTHRGGRGKIRKEALLRLVREGFLDIASAEVITAIRLPITHWTHWQYRKIQRPFTSDQRTLIIAMVARVEKAMVLGFHLIILTHGQHLFYDYNLNTQAIGRRYPLSPKDRDYFLELLQESLTTDEESFSDYMRHVIEEVVIDFLQGRNSTFPQG